MDAFTLLSDTLRRECPNTQCMLITKDGETTIELREGSIKYQINPSEIDSVSTVYKVVYIWQTITSKE